MNGCPRGDDGPVFHGMNRLAGGKLRDQAGVNVPDHGQAPRQDITFPSLGRRGNGVVILQVEKALAAVQTVESCFDLVSAEASSRERPFWRWKRRPSG